MTTPSIRFRAVRRLASSSLGPFVLPYATQLQERGYSLETIRDHLSYMINLGRWLTRTGRDLRDLNQAVLDRFWRYRSRPRKRVLKSPAGHRLLALLRQAQVTPPCEDLARTPTQRLVLRYRRYLVEERGLSDWTIDAYGRHVRRFVTDQFGAGTASVSQIRARAVLDYVQAYARTGTPQDTGNVVTALRSFLRFLHYQGLIRADLASVIPAVARWRMTGLPKHLPADAVRQVLERCDQTTPIGQRDYAILLLLARLGLRAGEVVSLQLEDIDWEGSQITIRSKKGRGWARLPLPADVGKALARYLRHGRPSCDCRHVFVRSLAPHVGFTPSGAISHLTRQALQKAGVQSARTGAHVFRHGLATAMLHQGASLDEIGQVLRHQTPNSTAIYAKVDLDALRRLAVPWPGGGQ
ncbi:MAG: site-specific integrase [Verrucomicrobiales bacterium]|nr:site-specific integrase [Verrucomicrobiales bacterium]